MSKQAAVRLLLIALALVIAGTGLVALISLLLPRFVPPTWLPYVYWVPLMLAGLGGVLLIVFQLAGVTLADIFGQGNAPPPGKQKPASPHEEPSNDGFPQRAEIESLLGRTYDLIQYVRERQDQAPIPSQLSDRAVGHVDSDTNFLSRRAQLKREAEQFVVATWGGLEHQRLVSQLERVTLSVPPDKVPQWKGLTRCRCWWDAKDELQGLADYLHEQLAEGMPKNRQVMGNVGADLLINQHEAAILLEIYKLGKGDTAIGTVDVQAVGRKMGMKAGEIRSAAQSLEGMGLIRHFEDTGRLFVITQLGIDRSRRHLNDSGN